MGGIFTISLDFELHWGVFDKRERNARKTCYQNTLNLVPRLLDSFSENDVHVTWATVGSLFAEDEKKWSQLKPEVLPTYTNLKYSAYEYASTYGLKREDEWAHFAPDAIQQIISYPGQELGTHTFGHFYCLEPEQSKAAFEADLDSAVKAANSFKQKVISLVFPRNQFNASFLGICYDKGIRTVRSNPNDWFWTPVADGSSGIARKVFRTGDAYLPFGKRTSYPLSSIRKIAGEPLQLPASRLLRSRSKSLSPIQALHLKRVLREMTVAAQKNECYHLWWHPENFGDFPEENMQQLTIILDHYRSLQKKFGMKSWNMGEYLQIT